jgi:hypothetical protein
MVVHVMVSYELPSGSRLRDYNQDEEVPQGITLQGLMDEDANRGFEPPLEVYLNEKVVGSNTVICEGDTLEFVYIGDAVDDYPTTAVTPDSKA